MLTATGLRTHIWNNNLRSVVLLALFPVLLIALAFGVVLIFSGLTGTAVNVADAADDLPRVAPYAAGASAIWFTIAWFSHNALIERATGAVGVTESEAPIPYRLLENLCISRGMSIPKLKIAETPAMNAFASGLKESNYSVTLTRGLIDRLNEAELEAVIGHELAHIRHRDVRLLVIAIIFVGIFSFFGEMVFRSMFRVNYARVDRSRRGGGGNAGALIFIGIAVVAVAYVLAVMVRFALSRKREYMADAGAVEMTKNPDAMISALQKISDKSAMPNVPAEVMEMAFHMPKVGLKGAFSTHPPIDKRIAALVDYAGGRLTPPTQAPSLKNNPWT